ncbi:response regulator [Chryseobacterium kwangjuense]|uniref:LuxR family transcriptional regulator n=1 Tax=Chryseobacterium kwangjuense TaxID=267125 RepID=A0A135WHF5_9FLAO|nr:response regulator transcription factor [Chryseobacterium kwangjuense]KXH84347.1 LuxR family transcriptional regulator [Chryseobacterium kwangjuense]
MDTQIAILDDHPILVQGLKMMLDHEKDFNIVATFLNGNDIVNFMTDHRVDVILLDVTLPDKDGIELCREIKSAFPECRIIMLSNHMERSIIMKCMQNGANGYLLKNISVSDLLQSIKEVMAGNIVFCNDTKKIISKILSNQPIEPIHLTKREKQIIRLLAQGKTSNNIAQELFLSPLTVDTYRKNLLQKFQVKNSAELVSMAIQKNIIDE